MRRPLNVGLALALAPLTMLLARATAEGHLNFGGGTQDVLLAAPMLL